MLLRRTLAVAALVAAVSSAATAAGVPQVHGISGFADVLQAVDEVSAFFIHDSADANSLTILPVFEKAAASLAGFANFHLLDIRDPELRWLFDAWNVQIVPAVRGMPPQRQFRQGWDALGLSDVGGVRGVKEMPLEKGLSEATVKAFVLSLQGEAPITRIESDAKAQLLHKQVTGAGRPVASVVLVSSKPTSSQLYKAVTIGFADRCEFFDVFTEKAKGAEKLFDVTGTPALLAFARDGTRHVFAGKLTAAAIGAFLDRIVEPREAAMRRRQHNAAAVMEREAARHRQPVLRVASSAEWDIDVAKRQSITCVFVVDSVADTAALESAVRGYKKNLGADRSPVGQFVYLIRSDAPELASRLVSVDGSEAAAGACISSKKGTMTQIHGGVSAEALQQFITGPLARGVGAKPIQDLTAFQ